jgi:IclR family pca regulon transcriptional regulator
MLSSSNARLDPRGKPLRAGQGVEAVSHALDLLCCFSAEHPEWGVTEMARYLGLSKAAVHRILITCEYYGLIEKTSQRRYRLGPRVLELGNVYRFDRRFIEKAEPAMRRLAEHTQSTVHLGVLEGRDVLELHRCSAAKAVRFTASPRFRMSVHATGLGKVLLATGEPGLFEQVIGDRVQLKQFTQHTITRPDKLRQELETVATQGYAVADQEATIGCRCLAVPIRDRIGSIRAALSISNTVETLSGAQGTRFLNRLFETAEAIRRSL